MANVKNGNEKEIRMRANVANERKCQEENNFILKTKVNEFTDRDENFNFNNSTLLISSKMSNKSPEKTYAFEEQDVDDANLAYNNKFHVNYKFQSRSKSPTAIRAKTEANGEYFRGQIVTTGLFPNKFTEERLETCNACHIEHIHDNFDADQSLLSLNMDMIKGKGGKVDRKYSGNNKENVQMKAKVIQEISRIQSFWRGYAFRCKLYHTLYKYFAGISFKQHMKKFKVLFRTRLASDFIENFKILADSRKAEKDEEVKIIINNLSAKVKNQIIEDYLKAKMKSIKISNEVFSVPELERKSLNGDESVDNKIGIDKFKLRISEALNRSRISNTSLNMSLNDDGEKEQKSHRIMQIAELLDRHLTDTADETGLMEKPSSERLSTPSNKKRSTNSRLNLI